MSLLAWWLVAGLFVLVLLIASGWFDTRFDRWLMFRMAVTVALWPAPLTLWALERFGAR